VEDLDAVEDLNADAKNAYDWYCESLTLVNYLAL
jgi:hypothetical protein